MKTVSVAFATLLSVTALAPAAFAADPSVTAHTADALVASHLPALGVRTVTNNAGLDATVESLDGVPLTAGGEVRARVVASNLTDEAVEEVVLRLDLTRDPLTSRAELADFLEDPAALPMDHAAQEPPVPEQTDATEVDNVVVPSGPHTPPTGVGVPVATSDEDDETPDPVGERIAPRTDRTFTLEASAEDLDLPTRGWGVYGATLMLVTPDGEFTVDSFPLTWGAEAIPELNLAVIATASGLPSRVQGVLEASNLPGVSVAIDPAYVTPTTVIDAQLQDREVLRLPTHSPDLTSIAHAGNENLLPLALSLPRPSDIPAVTASPWLAVPAAVDGRSVALAGQADAAAVLALPSAAGYGAIAEHSLGAVAYAEGTPVLVPDAQLSTTVAQFRPGTPAAAALAVADSAFMARDHADAPALVTLDGQWHTGAGAQSTLAALLDAPWVSPVSVQDLLELPPRPITIADILASDQNLPVDQVEALSDRLDDLELLATVTESPHAAMTQWGSDLLRGISDDNRGQSAPRDLALRNALENADSTLSALRIADSSELNLLTESGDIPISVINGLDHAVKVTVDFHSYSSNLQVLDMPSATVAARSDEVVLVPVEAVSTANVFVSAVLRNGQGDAVSDTQPFSIRVRADWGNAATAVFTVVLVLLLVAGLIRTIRRGRKDTREEPSAPPETMASDDG